MDISTWTLLAAAWLGLNPANETWRIEIQQAESFATMMDQSDHFLAKSEKGWWGNSSVVTIHDVLNSQAKIRTLEFDSPVNSFAIIPDKSKLLVSTQDFQSGRGDTWLIDLKTGSRSIFAKGVWGTVAVDPSGNTAVILGHSSTDFHEQRFSQRASHKKFAFVYDLGSAELQAKTKTSIAREHQIIFGEHMFFAAGVGGNLYSRAQRTFPVLFKQDLYSLEISETSGEVGDRLDHFVQDQLPESLMSKWSTHSSSSRPNSSKPAAIAMPALVSEILIGDRFIKIPIPSRFYGYRLPRNVVLSIDPEVGARLTQHNEGGPYRETVVIGDRFYSVYHTEESRIFDCWETAQLDYRFPLDNKSCYLLSNGLLMAGKSSVQYYKLDPHTMTVNTPVWQIESNQLADESVWQPWNLAWAESNRNHMLLVGNRVILDQRTGEVKSQVPSFGNMPYQFAAPASFDSNNRAICFHCQSAFHLFDNQRRTFKQVADSGEGYQRVGAHQQGWCFADEKMALFVDRTGAPIFELPIGYINRISPVEHSSLCLFQTAFGRIGIIDSDSGTVVKTWCVSQRSTHQAYRKNRPLIHTAFQGQIVIRTLPHAQGFELIGTQSLAPIFRIEFFGLDGKLGWIASSPDGRWDSTANAEYLVGTLRDGQLREGQLKSSRREKGLVIKRLRQALSGQLD